MFLQTLLRRNRPFLQAVVRLHQLGQIPANSYVLDIDSVQANAGLLSATAQKLGLKVYAMSKQFGRNPVAFRALAAGGIDRYVAVDMACARAVSRSGYALGHIGHLVQVPRSEARAAAQMMPEYWTVFSHEKAGEASQANGQLGRCQKLLARIHAEGDLFYRGHEGGFPAGDVVAVADALDALPHAAFAGVTTFPALLFDSESRQVKSTPNLKTLERAAHALSAAGRGEIAINAPGTTSSVVLPLLAAAGATQVEPGHGLTGSTPLHAVQDLPETPAILYLSEVAHLHNGRPYCFGGGLYIDPVFPDYDVRALVGADADVILKDTVRAHLPPPSDIDYYGILEPEAGRTVRCGDTVIFGFRAQAFFTRAWIVPVSGIASGSPTVEGVWSSDGQRQVL